MEKCFMQEIGPDQSFEGWRFEYMKEQKEAFQAGMECMH